jgi:hypothetical protein
MADAAVLTLVFEDQPVGSLPDLLRVPALS